MNPPSEDGYRRPCPGGRMSDELQKIRERANDPLLKWNILVAQADLQWLIARVEELQAQLDLTRATTTPVEVLSLVPK